MSRRERIFILLIALVARVVSLCVMDGTIWPDEYFQVLEPGAMMATGHGIMSWEWDSGIRSWAIPSLYGVLFRLGDWLGFDGPGEVAKVAQTINVGLSLVIVDGTMRIANALAGPKVARWAGLVAAVFPPLVHFAPHTLADCGATVFLLWSLARWVEATTDETGEVKKKASVDMLVAGLLAGASYAFRYTMPVFWAGPVLVALWQRRVRQVLWFAGGFAIVVVALGLLDWITWGAPFHSLAEYVRFNIIEDGASRFGTAPLGWYAGVVVERLGWLWPLASVVCARGLTGTRGIALGAGVACVLMSLARHKEERFIFPALALLPLFGTLGAWRFAGWVRERWRASVLALIATTTMASTWVAHAHVDWRANADWLRVMRWVGGRDDVSGVLVAESWVKLGGYSVHRLPVPMIADPGLLDARSEYHSAIDNRLFNYMVVSEARLRSLAGTKALGAFETLGHFGGLRVLRRR